MHSRLTAAVAGVTMMGLAGAAEAIPVDLELSLVIDSSGSISQSEFVQQIEGYANAFEQASVVNSIVNADNGIAVNTILFAGSATEVITFRQLSNATDVTDFVAALRAIDRIGGGTNVAAGVLAATESIATNEFDSGNIIIDVSGDGTSSRSQVQAARDNAISAGVSRINAVAIGGEGIFNFYRDNVIAGPGSFVLRAEDFNAFGEAIANKIQVEIGVPDDPEDDDDEPVVVAVPAPGAIGLLGLGVFALGWVMRRRPIA